MELDSPLARQQPDAAGKPPRLPFFAWAVALLALADALLATFVYGFIHQPLPLAPFLMDDGFLLMIDRALAGGHALYRDIQWPYGPIPIFAYAALAGFLGNNALTILRLEWILSALSLVVTFEVYRKLTPRAVTCAVSLLVFVYNLPLLDFLSYHYFVLIFVLLLVRFWQPPATRSASRGLICGVLLAAMHLSKFGTQVMAGLAVVTVDVLAATENGVSLKVVRNLIWSWIPILAGYVGIIAPVGAFMLINLSPTVTFESLFPLYMRQNYSFVTSEIRYPEFTHPKTLLTAQLPVILGLVALIAFFVVWAARSLKFVPSRAKVDSAEIPSAHYAMGIPPLIYAFSCFLLFRHAWHYSHDAVFAVLGIPLLFCCFGARWRDLTLLLLLPCLAYPAFRWLKVIASPPTMDPTRCLTTPIGPTFSVSPDEKAHYQAIFDIIQRKTQALPTPKDLHLLFLDWKPGVYFYSGANVVGRNVFYFPHSIRPWEAATFRQDLTQANVIGVAFPRKQALTLSEITPENLLAALRYNAFPDDISSAIIARLTEPVCAGVDPYSQRQVWIFSTGPNP